MNRDWILQAAEALTKIPATERSISTSILAVSEETRKKIQDRIDVLRREIFELAKADTAAETVMQFSLQFFPKSNTRRRKA